MHNTARSQETNIHDVIGIRILDPTNRTAADLSLRSLCHLERFVNNFQTGRNKEGRMDGKTGEKERAEGVKVEGERRKVEKKEEATKRYNNFILAAKNFLLSFRHSDSKKSEQRRTVKP